MTGTNCDLFTHKSSRSYLNHLVCKNMDEISILYKKMRAYSEGRMQSIVMLKDAASVLNHSGWKS
jgi:hypothetical protein